jgi:hypothetical protein
MKEEQIQANSKVNRTSEMVFIGYTLAVLVDLTVINLFDEYWDLVTIDSFTISLLTAVLMQVLLKLTIATEHKIANYFKQKETKSAKILRLVTSYLILVISKFVILGIVNFVFGDKVSFTGPWHGAVAFICLIIAILIAEFSVSMIYRKLKMSVETDG